MSSKYPVTETIPFKFPKDMIWLQKAESYRIGMTFLSGNNYFVLLKFQCFFEEKKNLEENIFVYKGILEVICLPCESAKEWMKAGCE